MLKVVAALIMKDGKILIAKRSTGNKNVIGKWEFPGGKVEENETEKQAIEREIKEEFDILVKAEKFVTNVISKDKDRQIDLRLYLCKYIDGKIKLNDHSDYKWVNKSGILDYDLADLDVELVKKMEDKYS